MKLDAPPFGTHIQRGAKNFDIDALRIWVSDQRSRGRSIGFTCGAFDILHAGHVEYLARARKHCDRLIVAVNSDFSISRYKGPLRPVNRQEHRLKVVAALAAVNAVTLMDEPRPATLIDLLKPDLYIKGGDYTPDQLQSKTAVEAYGGKVICIPITFHTSTSAILERAAAIQLHEEVPRRHLNGERRLVFLDRDGTLIRNIPFLHDPSKVELLSGVADGLAALQNAGFTLVLVTNQQGIGLGYYNEQDFIEVNRALLKLLGRAGVSISRIYYCPHSQADRCQCRKPSTLLIEKALKYFEAKPERCYFLGDSAADCLAAGKTGCESVLISEPIPEVRCSYRADSFSDAVTWVLGRATSPAR